MRVIKIIFFSTCITLTISCKSNFYLHKSINFKNYTSIINNKDLKRNDTIWLTNNTVCISIGNNRVKLGSIKKGNEKGKWYYYDIVNKNGVNDTIYCYLIKKIQKNNTLQIFAASVNRAIW